MAIDHLPGVARSAKRHRVASGSGPVRYSMPTTQNCVLRPSSPNVTDACSESAIAADCACKLGINRTIRAMSALTRRNASRRSCGLRLVRECSHGFFDIATHVRHGHPSLMSMGNQRPAGRSDDRRATRQQAEELSFPKSVERRDPAPSRVISSQRDDRVI